MFNDIIDKYKALPESVKNGILFLFAGWIWHFIVLYTNFFKGDIPTRQMIIGLCMLFLVYKMMDKSGWARALCMLSSVFIVVQYLPISLVFFSKDNFKFGVLAMTTVMFFSTSTYYLAVRESSNFFKKEDKPVASDQ